jgi:hypothetical protein
MTDCSEFAIVPGMNTRSLIPCRSSAALTTHTCTFAGAPAVATCTASVPIQASTLVSYVVSAVSANGQTTTAPEIAYSGGTQTLQRLARPVYWHRQLSRSSRIDVGSFPDSDYAILVNPYPQFTGHLGAILDGAYFNTSDPFARAYTQDRQFFNLWAGPFGADAEGCSRTIGGDAQSVAAVMDGSAIVHRSSFRDCASISVGGGAGSVQGTETDPAWLFVHESAHFLFGLSDEYSGGGYIATMPCNNVYANAPACQAAAPGNGATIAQCQQIGSTGFWRIATASETMANRNTSSDFRDDAARCVSNRLAACYNGSCY